MAASALSVPGSAAAGLAGGAVTAAIYDRRFPQGAAFADRASAGGAPVLSFSQDMTRLWFDEAAPRLRSRPGAIIGLTDARALFCFEQLAWGHGLRVRFRVDHPRRETGFAHVSATPLPAGMLQTLAAAGAAFGGCSADMALRGGMDWGDCTHAVSPHAPTPTGDRLVTWVIAPPRSA